jgi:6-phosphogluconolactonase
VSTPQLVVHRDKELMAQAAAARLITKIVDAQASTGSANVVLTGGRNGNGVLAALAAAPARDAIDWGRLDLWWGDERFLPEGDPERNVTQARQALLDSVPLDPKRVHAMPASDGPYGTDVEAAAEAYAEELARAAGPQNHGAVPTFDVLMLGVGPDTHVASLFPEHPGVRETERTVIGVHGSPKPPPTRISLTLPAIRWRRARTRPTRWRWPCRARARSRPPPRAPTAGPAPCGSWTRRRPRSCRGRCIRRPRPEEPAGPAGAEGPEGPEAVSGAKA